MAKNPWYISVIAPEKPAGCAKDTVLRSRVGGIGRLAKGFVHIIEPRNAILIACDLVTYHISECIVSRYGLVMGDFIEVKLGVLDNKIAYEVKEVMSIAEQRGFENAKTEMPSKVFEIWNQKVFCGQRILVVGEKTDNRVQKIVDSVSENLMQVALVAEDSEAVVEYLDKSGIKEVYPIQAKMTPKRQIVGCLYALFRAKQLSTDGHDVVFYVDSLSKLMRIYNRAMTSMCTRATTAQINEGAVSDLKEMVLSAKQLSSKGSLTVIGFINKPASPIEHYVYDEFSDLMNKILDI